MFRLESCDEGRWHAVFPNEQAMDEFMAQYNVFDDCPLRLFGREWSVILDIQDEYVLSALRKLAEWLNYEMGTYPHTIQ